MSPATKTSTLRKSMNLLNFIVFIFIGLLVIAYSYQFFSMETKLGNLEDFHDLFDNVLEVRRYEKNYFLHVGSENIEKITEYLDRIDADISKQEKDIIRVIGLDKFREFRANLDAYRRIFTTSSQTNGSNTKIDKENLRQKGMKMVDLTRELLDNKQLRIRNSFKFTISSFILITGIFFLFIIIGLRLQAKSVLDRIAFVQRATKSIIAGNFKPIDYHTPQQDEITDLIRDFNTMAYELDTRQEQLIQSRKLAAIGTFSSGIAHELNNPLNNISLSADTLHENFDDLTREEFHEIITDIINETHRASEVVKNILDFSRDQKPVVQLLNIKEVVASTKKLIDNELRLNAIWLVQVIPANLPPVWGEMQKLQQVFLNLFLNAIHVMSKGGLIHVDAQEDPPGYIRINVNDTGTGIEPENIEHIFDPFYTTKEVGKGTGLGLSIVYGIVKKHGGYIEVKSEMNVGTTFSIILPIAAETPPQLGNDTPCE
ncbi:MAG: HAMP domain-containing histidine kinase [Proteobacteria bacterium]|nr:HAMP domain-containing histidine kinase [Pseudomonadota bacterium]MBU1641262.1 HAMP domain-containing histidine kinase [Pseudomonadota bacterium]